MDDGPPPGCASHGFATNDTLQHDRYAKYICGPPPPPSGPPGKAACGTRNDRLFVICQRVVPAACCRLQYCCKPHRRRDSVEESTHFKIQTLPFAKPRFKATGGGCRCFRACALDSLDACSWCFCFFWTTPTEQPYGHVFCDAATSNYNSGHGCPPTASPSSRQRSKGARVAAPSFRQSAMSESVVTGQRRKLLRRGYRKPQSERCSRFRDICPFRRRPY